eukprot:sb/3470154/
MFQPSILAQFYFVSRVATLLSCSDFRKAMLIPCCDDALQNAAQYNPSQFKVIEKARWLWDKNEREDAMTLLSSYLNESESSSAEAHLLHAKWRNETSSYDSEAIQQLFKKVIEIDPQWEEAHFALANFFYKWSKAVPTIKPTLIPHLVKHYGESLKYGSNNIYQSLPRLLTNWMELETTNLGDSKKREGSSTQVTASQVSKNQDFVARTQR